MANTYSMNKLYDSRASMSRDSKEKLLFAVYQSCFWAVVQFGLVVFSGNAKKAVG